MIQLFCGIPGGGKSYDVVKNRFIPAFKAGRMIFTNIDGLNLDYICAFAGVEESFKDKIVELVNIVPSDAVKIEWPEGPFIAEYLPHVQNMELGAKRDKALKFLNSRKGMFRNSSGRLCCSVYEFYFYMPAGSLAIVDETQNYWSAKDWANVDISLDYYLSMHRHYGHDIAFVSQKTVRVYKEIQRLAEYVWTFEKLGWLGMPTRYKASCSIGVNEKRVYARHIRRYDSKYFPCYKSFVANDVKEQKIESAKMYSPFKIALVAGFVILFLIKFIDMPWFNAESRKKVSGVAWAESKSASVSKSGSVLYAELKEQNGKKRPLVFHMENGQWVETTIDEVKSKKKVQVDKEPGQKVLNSIPFNNLPPAVVHPDLKSIPHMGKPESKVVDSVSTSAEPVKTSDNRVCSGDVCYYVIDGELVEIK